MTARGRSRKAPRGAHTGRQGGSLPHHGSVTTSVPERAELGREGAGPCTVGVMAVDVCAHITGTVWKIEVAVGDSVQEEQTLVILESMKMEMPVEAPEDGRVASIAVSEGQAVAEGDVLLTLE